MEKSGPCGHNFESKRVLLTLWGDLEAMGSQALEKRPKK